MAIISGPFNFTGSFGNTRYYYDPVLKLRIAAGIGIHTRASFWGNSNNARAWDLVREFGGRSKWASLVRKSLSDIEHLLYRRCFNQIQTSGYLIQQLDETGIDGLRGVVVKNDPEVLLDINLNERIPFSRVMRGNYVVNLSPDKKNINLTIPGFITSKYAHWKANFFAVRFYLVAFQISDMVWNPETQKYEPVVSDLELRSVCTVSEWIYRNGIPVDVILQASLEEAALTHPGTTLAVALGVEFSVSAFRGQPNVRPDSGSAAIISYFTV